MAGKQVKPDWIAWEPARWIAGTAEMDQITEFVFFRLCMFAYVEADPVVRGSEKRNAMRCKVAIEEYREALDLLVELEKVSITETGVFVHSTEGRLRDSVSRISARQRGAAISRRRRELKAGGKKPAEINLIISKEFPDDQSDDQCSNKTDNNKTDNNNTNTQGECEGGQLELVPSEGRPNLSQQAAEIWNIAADRAGLAKVQTIGDAREKKLKSRLEELGGIEGWKLAVSNVVDSDFLCGRVNGKDWKATFDFLLQPQSLTKVMERSYPPYRSEGGSKGSATMNAIRGI